MKITSLIKFYIIKWYYDVYNYFTVYPDYIDENLKPISKSKYKELELQKDIDDYNDRHLEYQTLNDDDK